jgi:predicted metal-dependent enzyme (double-stranded beta helix superfamily)
MVLIHNDNTRRNHDPRNPSRSLPKRLRLDAAFDTPADFARLVREALSSAARDERLLAPAEREGDANGYTRHLLAADPRGRYAVAALVWAPGQASPVHAHRTWCGYAVIEGSLVETLYRWDPAENRAYAVREQARDRGAVSFAGAGRGAIHQLGNATQARQRAISLHVYGVAAAHIATHVNDLVAV